MIPVEARLDLLAVDSQKWLALTKHFKIERFFCKKYKESDNLLDKALLISCITLMADGFKMQEKLGWDIGFVF